MIHESDLMLETDDISSSNEDGPDKAFQVIILGGGGGPVEDDVTGLLVRSTGTQWAKNSILAVDAGVHLSAIVHLMDTHLPSAVRHDPDGENDEDFGNGNGTSTRKTVHHRATRSKSGFFSPISTAQDTGHFSPAHIEAGQANDGPKLVMTTGPFKDLLLPCESAKANALYLLRHLISTYLITHAHLDHLSGFAINTAAFQFTTRPKKMAAFPHTINAIKTHIFNDVIWPNLSDEEGGVGLVSFQRLTEGGNLSLGDGEGRGYVEVCDGLAVKGWGVSHGHCMRQHHHRGSISQEFSFSGNGERRGSHASLALSPGYRRLSLPHNEFVHQPQMEPCVTDSSAFFILDEHTRKEILMFGDVEPDSISLSPRTARVWTDAAPKIAAGLLKAIFIECSYDDSQPDETLFGHLSPHHLIAELLVLAEKVTDHRAALSGEKSASEESTRKRKREVSGRMTPFAYPGSPRGRANSPSAFHQSSSTFHRRTRSSLSPTSRAHPLSNHESYPDQISPTQTQAPQDDSDPSAPLPHRLRTSSPSLMNDVGSSSGLAFKPQPLSPEERRSSAKKSANNALKGVKVVVIHVKDTLRDLRDGPPANEIILQQLRTQAKEVELGAEIEVARKGDVFWL